MPSLYDLGSVPLGGTLTAAVLCTDYQDVPRDPPGLPSYRVYGQGTTPMSNGLGNAQKLDTGAITNATNASPIQVTAPGSNLNTGTRVNVSGVLGNTGAVGETTVTFVDANTFTLDNSSGNGAYAGGGVWHVAGLYQVQQAINPGDGYAQGQTYYLLLSWTLSGNNYAALCVFRVV